MSAPTASAPHLLAAGTSMGSVTLRVADLDAMTAYYRDAVRLSVLATGGDHAVLGRGSVADRGPPARSRTPARRSA